jgi:hypothetical protein
LTHCGRSGLELVLTDIRHSSDAAYVCIDGIMTWIRFRDMKMNNILPLQILIFRYS